MRKLIDFFFIHAECPVCEKIGHKENMHEKWFVDSMTACRAFYHEKCRETTFDERLCECKENWIEKKFDRMKQRKEVDK